MDLTNYSAFYIWLDAGNYRSTLISDIKLNVELDCGREIQPIALIDDQEIIMDPACYPVHKWDDNLYLKPVAVYIHPHCRIDMLDSGHVCKLMAVLCEPCSGNADSSLLIPINPGYADLTSLINANQDKYNQHNPVFSFTQRFHICTIKTLCPIGYKDSARCPFAGLYYWGYHWLTGYKTFGQGLWSEPLGTYLQPSYNSNKNASDEYDNSVTSEVKKYMTWLKITLDVMGFYVTKFEYSLTPGFAEIEVTGDGIKACYDIIMLRWILRCYNWQRYEFMMEPVGLDNREMESGCYTRLVTNKMVASGGKEYVTGLAQQMSQATFTKLAYYNLFMGGSLEKDMIEKCKKVFEPGFLSMDKINNPALGVDIIIPLKIQHNLESGHVNDAEAGLVDTRPAHNVCPYNIASYMLEHVFNYDVAMLDEQELD